MALFHVEFFSEVLGLSSSIDVLVPQRKKGQIGIKVGRFEPPYPVLYLLHGGSDNHTNWQRNTSIERYVADLGLVVVMPTVQYSFYTDQKYGFNYFTYLSQELPQIVQEFFHVSDQREDTFAAGLSMGGYGAFKLGISCYNKFAAVASLSGSIDQRDRLTMKPSIENQIMLQMARNTFGSYEDYDRSDNDLAWLMEKNLAKGVKLPKFYQACGTKDHNYQVNVEFYRRFKDQVDLTYEELPDRGHDWGFWDEYIQHVLKWLPIRKSWN
ncbi:MAG: esterase family protein [Bacilli bacterium]|nr:esterase family protein [Bacilli bacterium]